ncbi:hypothetical protein HELRODRAFT_116717 [Helobdella robusta]|uniref:Potassium channel domain-containing protein n=1 Tax=Helobdella robusta TaxID=6412 RepID=T1EGH1_HELRO|nr:hypothetical protein HELRODRAFT_116717 [Helobdella robusta]ESN89916.1 hypothetical protein HELRODRAFT_116717 [Helobdella robusta]
MPEYTHHSHRPSSPTGQPPLRNGQKIKNCCKNLGSFLFSQVGLATMVILYSVMGGILFKAIEGPSEKKVKEIMRFKWDDTAGEIMNLAIHLNIPTMNHTQFADIIKNVLYRYQEVIVMAVKNEGFNGKFGSDESSIQWSFAGSLLYAVTVITTIGYGHVVPKTPVGRLVTILYALLGIPLTFLYLSNVGNFAAKCFRLFYKKFCCGLCIYVRLLRHKRRMLNVRRQAEAQMKSQEAFDSIVESTFISAKRGGASEDDLEYVKMTVPISICLIIITLYIYLGAQLFSYWEKWDLITSSYFCFITLSTIGFGDLVPGIDSSQEKAHQKLMLCSLWLVVGLSLLAMCFNLMQEEVKENFRWIGMKLGVLKQ